MTREEIQAEIHTGRTEIQELEKLIEASGDERAFNLVTEMGFDGGK